jgi:hypothetical protein
LATVILHCATIITIIKQHNLTAIEYWHGKIFPPHRKQSAMLDRKEREKLFWPISVNGYCEHYLLYAFIEINEKYFSHKAHCLNNEIPTSSSSSSSTSTQSH